MDLTQKNLLSWQNFSNSRQIAAGIVEIGAIQDQVIRR